MHHGVLGQHRHELGVHEVDLVHPAVLGRAAERLEQGLGDLPGVVVPGRFREAGPGVGDSRPPEPVPGDALRPGHVGDRLDAALPEPGPQSLGLAHDVAVIAAREATVAAQDEDRGPLRILGLPDQRMVDIRGLANHRLDSLGEFPGVGPRVADPLLGLDDPRGRDQLLGTGRSWRWTRSPIRCLIARSCPAMLGLSSSRSSDRRVLLHCLRLDLRLVEGLRGSSSTSG